MHKFLIFLLLLWLPAASVSAEDVDYSQGVLFINEDWYGHQNSTVNYLLPDDPDGDYWHYRVIQKENPGMELGCTNQYGAIWRGRLYLIAKQEKDPGADITGGRITIANARTMKIIKQMELIDPSGNQCDGRAFCGVSDTKGYVSSSNGIWILNLATLEIEGQVEGSENPNVGGDSDKPNTDPTSSLYFGQTGTMILAEGKVFAVHQQYGLLVIDPQTDRVSQVLDMGIIESETGHADAGIGSTLVRSKDGNIWYSVAKNVQGTGTTLPYLIRLDPLTLEREVIQIEGDDVYPPSNSWYAWTPDPFCASAVTNRLYWCGGPNSWFTNYRVYRYDIDSRRLEKILDFSEEEGDWHIYGCSLGIHPATDELYASMFHKFVDPTYVTRRFDADGNLIKEYPMISNYWFPSLPVFPQFSNEESSVADIEADSRRISIVNLQGRRVYSGVLSGSDGESYPPLSPGVYIITIGDTSKKVIIK